MTVFITGGSGFVGLNLIEQLLELTSGEGPGQAAVFGIFHGALPIGTLVLPDQSPPSSMPSPR